VVLALSWIATSSADKPPAPASAADSPSVFSHKSHAEKLDVTKCESCHQAEQSVREAPVPTTRSHAPCLASGCHIDQFLSTGPRTKKEDPKAFAEATIFCAVCHNSSSGAPPSRFARAKADALFESKVGADYHVEMNHQKHTGRTNCSTCHVVDTKTFALVKGRPSHKECGSCHDSEHKLPMSQCATCHSDPGTTKYFTKTRKSSDVRVCEKNSDPSKPCFKHERTEHRFAKEAPIECSSCHYMVNQKKHAGHSYESLADVKSAPIMDNARDMAHKHCGTSGCHKRDVDDSLGKARCGQCHSKKFMASSLFN